MLENTAERSLGFTGEISIFSVVVGACGGRLSIKTPDVSTLCCVGADLATCNSSLSQLLEWKTGFCWKAARTSNCPFASVGMFLMLCGQTVAPVLAKHMP